MALAAPVLAPNDPGKRVGRPHQPPTVEHYSAPRMGRDVYTQLVWGARTSLLVGFAAGLIITALGTLIGLIAGYFGGWIDGRSISSPTSCWSSPTSAAARAGLLRRHSRAARHHGDHRAHLLGLGRARHARADAGAAQPRVHGRRAMVGEPAWRMMVVEIMPNLLSIIGFNFIGSVIYAIIAQATLEFLGLGDPLRCPGAPCSTMPRTPRRSSSAPGGNRRACAGIALIGLGLALINFAVDEIANPQLRSGPALSRWLRSPAARCASWRLRR